VKSKKFQEVNLTKLAMSKLPPDAELLAIEQASIRLGKSFRALKNVVINPGKIIFLKYISKIPAPLFIISKKSRKNSG